MGQNVSSAQSHDQSDESVRKSAGSALTDYYDSHVDDIPELSHLGKQGFYVSPESPQVTMLSIDGGGVRGCIAAAVLVQFEEVVKKEVRRMLKCSRELGAESPYGLLWHCWHTVQGVSEGQIEALTAMDFFDICGGTSTGGLIAMMLSLKDSNRHQPKYKALEVLRAYLEFADAVFPDDFGGWGRTFRNFRSVQSWKYNELYLEEKLKARLGENTTVEQCIKPCIVPSFDFTDRTAFTFDLGTLRQDGDPLKYVKLWQVGRATSAAPTFFKPMPIDINNKTHYFLDGGLFKNNPTDQLHQFVVAALNQHMYDSSITHMHQAVILSIGTGKAKPVDANPQEFWLKTWAHEALKAAMDGSATATECNLQQVFERHNRQQAYVRVQPDIPEELYALDLPARRLPDLMQAADAYLLREDLETGTTPAAQLALLARILAQSWAAKQQLLCRRPNIEHTKLFAGLQYGLGLSNLYTKAASDKGNVVVNLIGTGGVKALADLLQDPEEFRDASTAIQNLFKHRNDLQGRTNIEVCEKMHNADGVKYLLAAIRKSRTSFMTNPPWAVTNTETLAQLSEEVDTYSSIKVMSLLVEHEGPELSITTQALQDAHAIADLLRAPYFESVASLVRMLAKRAGTEGRRLLLSFDVAASLLEILPEVSAVATRHLATPAEAALALASLASEPDFALGLVAHANEKMSSWLLETPSDNDRHRSTDISKIVYSILTCLLHSLPNASPEEASEYVKAHLHALKQKLIAALPEGLQSFLGPFDMGCWVGLQAGRVLQTLHQRFYIDDAMFSSEEGQVFAALTEMDTRYGGPRDFKFVHV